MAKLKLKSGLFKSFNKSTFSYFFTIFFLQFAFFHIYECLKTYQLNIVKKIKKDFKRKPMKDIKIKKEEKQQYGRECYKNLSEDEKQKLVEYRKNIIE